MTKNKVGAEPKKRVKHVFTKDAGIHEGIHRDEPGWYDSNYHCYCFAYGYFFHRGKSLGKNLTPDYIKELNSKIISSNDYDDYDDKVFDTPIDIPIILVGEVIDVRHEQPRLFSKGKTIYIVRVISDNSIREIEATKCKVKYK